MTEIKKAGKSRSLLEAMDKYKATGNNEFFTLEDDGDTAIVRFHYQHEDDLDWFVVHEAEIGGKKRWVQCTEEEDCPMCLKLKRPSLKLFIQLIQKGKEDVVMTWERGQQFIPQIMDLFKTHGSDLTQHIFEIERKGKKGDQRTKYVINHVGHSPTDVDSLQPKQDFLAEDGFILVKTHAEMDEILSGNFQYQKVDAQKRERPLGNRDAKKDVEVF